MLVSKFREKSVKCSYDETLGWFEVKSVRERKGSEYERYFGMTPMEAAILKRELEERSEEIRSFLCSPCRDIAKFMLEQFVVYRDCGASIAAINIIAAEAEAAFPGLFLIITPISLGMTAMLKDICEHYDMDYIKENIEPLAERCCKEIKLC